MGSMMARRKKFDSENQTSSCFGCSIAALMALFFIGMVCSTGATQWVCTLVLIAVLCAYIWYNRYKNKKLAAEAAELEKARNSERIEIIYEDRRGNVTKRRVTPMHLKGYDDGSWVLDAFCEEKQAVRSFYISRIVRAIDCETGEQITTDLVEYIKTWAQAHGGEAVEVKK